MAMRYDSACAGATLSDLSRQAGYQGPSARPDSRAMRSTVRIRAYFLDDPG